ncbi:MAG: hypothetical protein J5602_11775, partial [Clostridia bacterium]|nr:hypothetical protein [Clostridia bacterium]
MKKILALALMALLILSALPARADGENLELVPPSGPVNPYGLGFETFPPKTRSSTISVITLQEPVLGSTGRWSVQSEGATEYQFSLCPYDANLSVQETNFIQRYSSDNTFSYTFYEAGQYVLFLYVKDSSGSVKRDYFYFSVADMPGAVSVSSRVSEIVAECQTNVSGEYETAVWLHDWITHNAYYDESYSNYGADGILFR